jgi:hypothetical protein
MINLFAEFAPSDFLRFLDVFSDTRRRFGARALDIHHEHNGPVTISLEFDNPALFEAFLAEPEIAAILRAARDLNGCELPKPEANRRDAA